MQRTVTPIDIGDHNNKRKRFMLLIVDDPSGPARTDIIRRRDVFLASLVDNPTLLQAGPAFVEKLTIFHNGKSWMLQAEAEADVP